MRCGGWGGAEGEELRLSAGSLVKVTLQSPGCVESVAAARRPAPAAAGCGAVQLSALDYAFAEINHIMWRRAVEKKNNKKKKFKAGA